MKACGTFSDYLSARVQYALKELANNVQRTQRSVTARCICGPLAFRQNDQIHLFPALGEDSVQQTLLVSLKTSGLAVAAALTITPGIPSMPGALFDLIHLLLRRLRLS